MKISMVMNGNLASSSLTVCELEALATKNMIFLFFIVVSGLQTVRLPDGNGRGNGIITIMHGT